MRFVTFCFMIGVLVVADEGAVASLCGRPKAPRSWQPGKVVEVRQEKQATGLHTQEGYDPYRGTGIRSPLPATTTSRVITTDVWLFTIETQTMRALCSWQPRRRAKGWLTELEPGQDVKFAVDGRACVLMGPDGKEVKLSIIRLPYAPECGIPILDRFSPGWSSTQTNQPSNMVVKRDLIIRCSAPGAGGTRGGRMMTYPVPRS